MKKSDIEVNERKSVSFIKYSFRVQINIRLRKIKLAQNFR